MSDDKLNHQRDKLEQPNMAPTSDRDADLLMATVVDEDTDSVGSETVVKEAKYSETMRAVVMGEVMNEWPQDLFIPPDALKVVLESFEGPLDLLLYLIRKQNLDILNIPVADITRQYMGYVELMRAANLDLAAESSTSVCTNVSALALTAGNYPAAKSGGYTVPDIASTTLWTDRPTEANGRLTAAQVMKVIHGVEQ